MWKRIGSVAYLVLLGLLFVGLIYAQPSRSGGSNLQRGGAYVPELYIEPSADGSTYEEFLSIDDGGDKLSPTVGGLVGGAGDKTRIGLINMWRPSTSGVGGDTVDTGWFIRVGNHSTGSSGYTMRGIDLEARSTGLATTPLLSGATITTHTDEQAGGGITTTSIPLKVEAKSDAVTMNITGIQLRMFRQAQVHPTTEYGLVINNANNAETGSGLDAGIRFETDATADATDGAYVVGIDMSPSTMTTAELKLSNSATLSNCYDMYRGEAQTESVILYIPDVDAVAASGDHTDTGLKWRINNTVNQPAGAVTRGLDVEARTTGAFVTNLHGANITATTHQTINSEADILYGAKIEAKANGQVNDSMVGAIVRFFRQAVADPTEQVVLQIQNASTAGTGVDAGISIESTGSGETDDFVVGIDLASADIDQADIVGSGGPKIFTGTAANGDAVYAEVGAYDATGSVYLSTNGGLYVQVANAGAAADWYKCTTTDAD